MSNMNLRTSFLLLALFWAWLLISAAPATAQDVEILLNEAIVDFPNEVTFRLELAPDSPIVSAVLVYDVEQISCLEADAAVPVELSSGRAEWTWVMIRSGNPPPGTTLWWQWQLTDAAGTTITTPRQEVVLNDGRFDWRTVQADGIQLHWYRGDEVGPLLLDAAEAGLAQLQDEMGIELQDEVQIFIYGSADDMRDAVLYIQDWAGGVAFSEHNVILIGVPPRIAEDWGRGTVRHELAHLVIGQFGWSCVGGTRPTWLNEGLAVLAEGDLPADFSSALDLAMADNRFEPVRSLGGAFPTHEETAGIAYAQSYSVVAYMLDAYGQEKMQQLLLTMADGLGTDQALEVVYGLNVDGLETAWRDHIGAPSRVIPPTPTPILPAAIPTIVLQGAPQDMPTPLAAAEPPSPVSTPSPGVCGTGMIPLFFIGLVGSFQSRRKRRRE